MASSRLLRLLAATLLCASLTVGVAAEAHAGPPTLVQFNGGGANSEDVMTGHPRVYLVFWGSQWGTRSTDSNGDVTFSDDPVGAAPGLQELFKGLGVDGESYSGIVTQYCTGVPTGATSCPPGNTQRVGYPTGGALAGVWFDASWGPVLDLYSKTTIAAEAVAAAHHFGNTSPASNSSAVYMIVMPHGTDAGGWIERNQCAYHDWNASADLLLTGGPVDDPAGPIAIVGLPYVADAPHCYGQNSLTSFTKEATHEWFEALTDPFPPSTLPERGGWYAPAFSEGNEIADQCNRSAQWVHLYTGDFVVQSLWSNDANTLSPNASTNCVADHPVVKAGGIVNGGFETGSLFGWHTSGTATLSPGDSPSGSHSAELGPASGDSTISQTFWAKQNTLSFWYRTVCPGSLNDAGVTVTLRDQTSSSTTTPLQRTCMPDSGWIPVDTMITPGHQYTLTFANHGDGSGGARAFFDDVVNNAGWALPAPTLTRVDARGQVVWEGVSTASGYVIYRDGIAVTTVPATSPPQSYYSWYDTPDGTSHTYRIAAYSWAYDISAPSQAATEPPRNLHRAEQGQVCWDPVAGHDGTGDVYAVFADGSATPADYVLGQGHDPTTEVCVDPGYFAGTWAPGTRHTLTTAAYNPTDPNDGGQQSQPSDPLTYTFVPAPATLTATQPCALKGRGRPCTPQTAALLQWTQLRGATYNVYRHDHLIARNVSGAYGYLDSTVSAATTYTYTVTAVLNGIEGLPSITTVHIS